MAILASEILDLFYDTLLYYILHSAEILDQSPEYNEY